MKIYLNEIIDVNLQLTILLLVIFMQFHLLGQSPNPVPGYSVLQQVVTKTGGGARTLQEGDNGAYYIEYSGSYNDTLLINSRENPLVFDGEFETIPHRYKKIIKYNSAHEPMAVQDIYSYQDLGIHDPTFKIEKMLFDGGDLFLEMEVKKWNDNTRSFYIGGNKVSYGPNNGEIGMSGQLIVVLDGESLEYKKHVMVQTDGQFGYESWNVKNGYLYFRHTPIRMMVVAVDTFTYDHGMYLRKWVNVVKYDYKTDQLEWSQVVASDLPLSGVFNFPTFLGLDVDDNDRVYISMGDLGSPYVLAQDTITYLDAENGHGALVVLDENGDVERSDIVDGDAFVLDVKNIGNYTYILIFGSSDLIDYRGVEIGTVDNQVSEEVFVIKVDESGEYINSYNTIPGCTGGFNYMKVDGEELLLFGQYYNLGSLCDGFTTEGQELIYEHSGSILTLDKDLNVLSNGLFSAESVDAIPLDGFLSSSGNLVFYSGNPSNVYWPYFDEEPFFFEDGQASSRSIVLAKDELVNTIDEILNTNLDITLYPNPTTQSITIGNIGSGNGRYAISIWNMNGTLLFKDESYTNESVDISHLSSGTYIVKIIADDHNFTRKLIKI